MIIITVAMMMIIIVSITVTVTVTNTTILSYLIFDHFVIVHFFITPYSASL